MMPKLSDYAVGDTIILNETISGVTKEVEFIVIARNHFMSGYTALMRKALLTGTGAGNGSYYLTGNNNTFCPYASSRADSFLSGTYINYLDDEVKNSIKEVPIVVAISPTTAAMMTFNRKIFILSAKEYNVSDSYTSGRNDGTAIAYFSGDTYRYASGTSISVRHCTRTPHSMNTSVQQCEISTTGAMSYFSYSGTFSWYWRPVFNLPNDFGADVSYYPVYTKQANAWTQPESISIKNAGTYKELEEMYCKDSGAWMQVYPIKTVQPRPSPELVLTSGVIGNTTSDYEGTTAPNLPVTVLWTNSNQSLQIIYTNVGNFFAMVSPYLVYQVYSINKWNELTDISSQYPMEIQQYLASRSGSTVNYGGVQVGFTKTLPVGEYELRITIYANAASHAIKGYLNFKVT